MSIAIENIQNITEFKKWLKNPQTIECETLDFKEALPDKDNVRKLFCALANTRGGFVVFGVTDKKDVVGISCTGQELIDKINNLLGRDIDPSTIQISLFASIKNRTRNNFIYVVEIKKSHPHESPHILIDRSQNLFRIPIRKNSSCDYLIGQDEVRKAFLHEGVFHKESCASVKRILTLLIERTDFTLNSFEASIIIQFQEHLLNESRFDLRAAQALADLTSIMSEYDVIKSMNGFDDNPTVRQQKVSDLKIKMGNHISNFSKFYE